MNIGFNRPYQTGKEIENIVIAQSNYQLSGDGDFTRKCQDFLCQKTGTSKTLLTHSCTAALEMAAILLDIKPGDEVIMPSYTFVSTANAFVLRGATPVFVDIRSDTLNIDEKKIESAITENTKAIVPVHYGGVSCEMDEIISLANKYKLFVVEDAAQAINSSYKGKSLGSIGDLGTLSFHETKNITSGEGGALLINNNEFFERAEIIREKGTNRAKFFREEINKYTWVDIGSSYLCGDMVAAYLYAQLESLEYITNRRIKIWEKYHQELSIYQKSKLINRPFIPQDCIHNAHLYYIILSSSKVRDEFINYMKNEGIKCLFHYIPLHDSPFGSKFGKTNLSCEISTDISSRLVRLPIWLGIEKYQDEIIHKIKNFFQ